jgi:hypothetical protein
MRRFGGLEQKAGGIKKTRAKPSAKYRSRKYKKLVWTGSGSMPLDARRKEAIEA